MSLLKALSSPKAGDRRDLPLLHQWRFNLTTGEVRERALDTEWGSEFARINEDYIGVRSQFTYAARIAGDSLESGFDGIIKYDLVNETSVHFPYGPGRLGGEPIFAPNPDGENEDDAGSLASCGTSNSSKVNASCWMQPDSRRDRSHASSCRHVYHSSSTLPG